MYYYWQYCYMCALIKICPSKVTLDLEPDFAKFAQVRLEIEEIELGNCYLILLRIYIYYDGHSILVAISGSTLYCYYWYKCIYIVFNLP